MSVRHQRIVSYSFGGGPRRFLIVGGIHGNEYGAAVGEALVQKLQSDPRLVPPGTRFDVIPDVNPDGHLADTRGNADGVDLNRNFPTADWSPVLSAGDTSSSRGLTGGSSPGSEPETQAIIRQLQTGYEAVMTLHSRAGIVDFNGPGGASLAASVSSVIGLPVEHLPYQSQIRGSMGEFVPVKFGIPVITLELTSSQLTTRTLMGVMAIAQ
jgi:predicted deacylase